MTASIIGTMGDTHLYIARGEDDTYFAWRTADGWQKKRNLGNRDAPFTMGYMPLEKPVVGDDDDLDKLAKLIPSDNPDDSPNE